MKPVSLNPRRNRDGILLYFIFLLLLACPLCCFSQNGAEEQLPALVFPPHPIQLQEPIPVLPVLAAQPPTTPHHPKTFDKKHDLEKIGARALARALTFFPTGLSRIWAETWRPR